MFNINDYSYGYGSRFEDFTTGMLVCFILALVGGITLYFTFLSKKNEHKFTGFVGWLYDFLSFKKLIVEAILKILYLVLTGFVTLAGIVILFKSFGTGLYLLIIGNIVIRVVYEFALILILICKNTSEINKKMKGDATGTNDMFVTEVELPKKFIAQNTHPVQPVQPVQHTQPVQPAQVPSFCPQCGKPINPTDDFCPTCGKKLK